MFTMLLMHDMENIVSNLTRLMSSSGLATQVKLARAAGISQTNLSNIMRSAVYPQLDTLAKLAKALRVDTWELMAPVEVIDLLRLYSEASEEDRATLRRVAASLAGHR